MVHDAATADAIAADAISRGFERAELHKPRHPGAWITQIAANMCRHWLRSRKIHERFLEYVGPPRDVRSAGDEVLGREALTLFKDMVDRLSDKQRRALLYRMVDHLPYEEIAELMGLRAGAVRALVLRARRGLEGWRLYMDA